MIMNLGGDWPMKRCVDLLCCLEDSRIAGRLPPRFCFASSATLKK